MTRDGVFAGATSRESQKYSRAEKARRADMRKTWQQRADELVAERPELAELNVPERAGHISPLAAEMRKDMRAYYLELEREEQASVAELARKGPDYWAARRRRLARKVRKTNRRGLASESERGLSRGLTHSHNVDPSGCGAHHVLRSVGQPQPRLVPSDRQHRGLRVRVLLLRTGQQDSG